ALDDLGGASVRAVVLLSDGRQAARGPAGRSPAVGAPVYAVAAAAPQAASRDQSISHVVVPAAAYPGEPFPIRARVHGVGLAAGALVEVRCTAGPEPAPLLAASPGGLAWAAARQGLESPAPLQLKLG